METYSRWNRYVRPLRMPDGQVVQVNPMVLAMAMPAEPDDRGVWHVPARILEAQDDG
jgi:hypothetical protein